MTPEEKMQEEGRYMKGAENTGIRWYYYLNSGLNVVNQFRNLLLGIFGLYITLKLENPLWLGLMFIVSLPVLILSGWYSTHRIAKVNEWLGMRFSTFYAIKQFNYTQGSYELLKEIKELLEKK